MKYISLDKLRKELAELSSVWLFRLSNKFTIGCTILSIFVITWKWNSFPPKIPLWYTRPWGEDQLTSPFWLILLPGLSLIIHVLNIALSRIVISEEKIFIHVLFLTSLGVSIASLIALVHIVALVT